MNKMKKKVLVTGSSRGIGAAIAVEFAKHNYDVIINYNNNKNAAIELSKFIKKEYDVDTWIFKCDIQNEDEIKEMYRYVEKNIGKIDCLINNAGIALDSNYQDKTCNEFKEVINTNLVGTFLVIKYFANLMDKGVIINIASNSAIDDNYIESMDYDSSKAGVISLTHNFAKALAPKIRVNAVAPGWIETDMNKNLNPIFKENIINKSMLKRIGEPEEVAKVVYFLASEEASYINNDIIRVDGGLE